MKTIEYVPLQTFNMSVTYATIDFNLLSATNLTLCMEASVFEKWVKTLICIITLLKICGAITRLDFLFIYTNTAKGMTTRKFTGLRRVSFLTIETNLGWEIFYSQMVALAQVYLAKRPVWPFIFTLALSLNSCFRYLYLKINLGGENCCFIWDFLTQYTRNTAIKVFICTTLLLSVV